MSHPIFGATRIGTHGQVTSLENDFSIGLSTPFSVFLLPKGEDPPSVVLLKVKLVNETTFTDMPFPINGWSEGLVKEIEAAEGLLDDYFIFWGY
jgi:hypothetical protein